MEEHFGWLVISKLLHYYCYKFCLRFFRLRLNGLELREIDNKIAKKLFENTSFNTLEPLWCAQNVFLFGKDIDVIKSIIVQTKKTNFLIPLGKFLLAFLKLYFYF